MELDTTIITIPQFLPQHCLVVKSQLNLEVIQNLLIECRQSYEKYTISFIQQLHIKCNEVSIFTLLDTATNQFYRLGFWEKLSLLLTAGRKDVGIFDCFFLFSYFVDTQIGF